MVILKTEIMRIDAISDAKLKENIVDASSQWEDIKNLRVRNYNFIEGHGDPSKTHIGGCCSGS